MMSKAVSSRVRNALINVVLILSSLVVAFVLAEIVLRVLGYSNPVLWTYDDTVGSRLYGGAEGWFRAEGEAYIKINSAGLRDREHSVAKPPNTVRIAVLGDSMTEALQVPSGKPFWAILERELNDAAAWTLSTEGTYERAAFPPTPGSAAQLAALASIDAVREAAAR